MSFWYSIPTKASDLFKKSDSLYNKGIYDEAYNLLIVLSNQFEQKNDSINLLKARLKIADINRAASNYQYALKYLKETERIFKNSTVDYNKLFEYRASIYYELNDKDSALKYIDIAFKERKRDFHNSKKLNNFLLFGAVNRFYSIDSATKYLLITEQYLKQEKDFLNLTLCYYNLGLCAKDADDNLLAEKYFLKEEKLADSLGIPVYQIQAYSNLMTLNYLKKDYQKVYEYYKKLNGIDKIMPEKYNLNKLISSVNSVEEIKQSTKEEIQRTKEDFQKKLNSRRNTILIGVVLILILLSFILFLKYQQHGKTKAILIKQQTLNTEIQNQKNALAKALFLKNKLISILGHDLLGPLRSLKAVLDLTADKEISENERKSIDQNIGNKLSANIEILTNLVAYAKSIEVNNDAKKATIVLRDAIEDTISTISATAGEKNISFQLEINETTCIAHPFFIEVALRNLINNAIKYSNNNSIIKVGTNATTDAIEIEIKDEGKGMSAETMEMLNRGAMVDSPIEGTKKEKGSGLGMRLVQEVARNLGYSITYKNATPKGVAAIIKIPK